MLFDVHMFIVGSVVWHTISKWYRERIDGIYPMACIFGIMTAGLTASPFYVPLCDAMF